jgi:methylated-DNA-[protein]-cysteine S-methyltransferase
MANKGFHEMCYSALRKVPRGKVTTYADLARSIGSKASRAVGNAMNRNPYAPKVPCHRVVRSNGEIGGYAKGPAMKIKMLRAEGIEIEGDKVADLEKVLFKFPKAATARR